MPHVLVAVVIGMLVGVLVSQVAFFVSTVYLHRALSHRAVTLAPGVAFGCRILTWMLTGIKPRQWVAVHRKHHAHTDEPGDPHSPVLLGYAKVQWANVALYRTPARDPATVARYARDLPADRFDRILFDRSLLGLGVGVGFLWFLFGWEVAVVAAGVHTVLYLLGSAAINAVGHHWGSRPYDNLATNNQWLAWLVAGEGLHNNHHAASTSSRFSLDRRQYDPGWWVVRLLVRMRCATLRHDAIAPKAPPPASVTA